MEYFQYAKEKRIFTIFVCINGAEWKWGTGIYRNLGSAQSVVCIGRLCVSMYCCYVSQGLLRQVTLYNYD
jgi:hypothetical protein